MRPDSYSETSQVSSSCLDASACSTQSPKRILPLSYFILQPERLHTSHYFIFNTARLEISMYLR